MRDCQRLCAALEGRTIAGWRIVEIATQEVAGIETYARLVLHVTPESPAAGNRSHWSASLLPIPRLRELLANPAALLHEVLPPEDHAA